MAEFGPGDEKTRMRILLVEDEPSDANAFRVSVDVYNERHQDRRISLMIATTTEEAKEQLTNYVVDCVIIDMRLENSRIEDGEEVLREITRSHRIPVAIMSGTPISGADMPHIPIFMKADARHSDVIDKLYSMREEEPLYRTLGYNGELDKLLRKIFWERLIGDSNIVKGGGTIGDGIDDAFVMRQIVVHLQALTTQSSELQKCEDMYIRPFDDSRIYTGQIVRSKRDDADVSHRIVLSPPCDLAIRDDKGMKASCILMCAIVPALDELALLTRGMGKSKKKTQIIQRALGNNHCDYWHWLAPAFGFEGGFVDFRDVVTCSPEEFRARFDRTELVVQEGFSKNVLRRFASYYNRQGQPDIDTAYAAERYLSQLSEEAELAG